MRFFFGNGKRGTLQTLQRQIALRRTAVRHRCRRVRHRELHLLYIVLQRLLRMQKKNSRNQIYKGDNNSHKSLHKMCETVYPTIQNRVSAQGWKDRFLTREEAEKKLEDMITNETDRC